MLSVNGFPISSAFESGGLPGTVGANAVASNAAMGSSSGWVVNSLLAAVGLGNNVAVPTANTSAPDANSGVGQMTITNGVNTPGIGSFAFPTCGTGSMGGTGTVRQAEPSAAS